MSAVMNESYHVTEEMLQRERSAVLHRIHAITQDALNFELESDGIPPSGHEGEQALIRMLDNRLNDIDCALARITDGSYGDCADCSAQIPPRRLEALPFATLCVACQSTADRKSRRLVSR